MTLRTVLREEIEEKASNIPDCTRDGLPYDCPDQSIGRAGMTIGWRRFPGWASSLSPKCLWLPNAE